MNFVNIGGGLIVEIVLLKDNEYDKWDEFVKEAINGTIYSESIWGKASKILDPDLNFKILTIQKEGTLFGGILLFEKNNKIVIPKFTAYTSVIYRKIDTFNNYKIISERRKINELIALYLKRNYKKIVLKQNIEYIDIRDFQFNKFSAYYLYTYYINLDKYNLKIINKKNKKDINNALEKNYEFELITNYNEIYNLLKPFFETMDKKVFSVDKKFKDKFINMVKFLKERTLFYVLKSEEDILSTRIVLIDNNKKIEGWVSGTTEKGRKERISSYFAHKILSDLKEKGYKDFDWDGANTPGVTDFKRNFGGELKPYSRLEFYKNKYYEALYKSAKIILKK